VPPAGWEALAGSQEEIDVAFPAAFGFSTERILNESRLMSNAGAISNFAV
jgi:hypothetical protein